MELHEKLQELRKQNGWTQEELAAKLYVSRTAVSKWESGRGYPEIESLKRMATVFSVTVDELLSSDELLTIAEENTKNHAYHVRDLVFGLLDVAAGLLLFLPLFAQRTGNEPRAVSLLMLNIGSPYLKMVYGTFIIGLVLWGILTLALQTCRREAWMRSKSKVSLALNVMAALLCILGLQPYAAVFLFVFLLIKVFAANGWR